MSSRMFALARSAGLLGMVTLCMAPDCKQVGDQVVRNKERIAFMSDRDGNAEIYTMKPDGTDQVRLTSTGADERRPQWTPLKERIVFESAGHIFSMLGDGSDLKQLTPAGTRNSSPSVSPQGSIAFAREDQAGNVDIYVIDRDGQNERRLTEHAGVDDAPAWSDGGDLAFQSDRDGPQRHSQIYLMDGSGNNVRRLTQTGDGVRDGSPTWAGNAVIFTRTEPAGQSFQRLDLATGAVSLVYKCQRQCGAADANAAGDTLLFAEVVEGDRQDLFTLTPLSGAPGAPVKVITQGRVAHNAEPNW